MRHVNQTNFMCPKARHRQNEKKKKKLFEQMIRKKCDIVQAGRQAATSSQ